MTLVSALITMNISSAVAIREAKHIMQQFGTTERSITRRSRIMWESAVAGVFSPLENGHISTLTACPEQSTSRLWKAKKRRPLLLTLILAR
jgi:hypothetical protein